MLRKTMISLGVALAVALPLHAQAKTAQCLVESNGVTAMSGPCEFTPTGNGSFMLSHLDSGEPLLDGVMSLSVHIIRKGVADVRAQTTHGVNSRWGEAKRSSKEKACWIESDFKICAW